MLRGILSFCLCWFSFLVAKAEAQGPLVADGEILVKYKSNRFSSKVLGKTGLRHGLYLTKKWDKIQTAQFKLENPNQMEAAIEDLKGDPDVAFVEPNYLVKAFDLAYAPTNDAIKAPESWNAQNTSSRSGSQTIVAVLDSGLDTTHSLFNGTERLWENEAEVNGQAGVDDDQNGYIDDLHGWNFLSSNRDLSDSLGHGTHVAGIVVGATEHYIDVTPSSTGPARVMVLKFLDENGVGKTSHAIEAIYYALNHGAKVINNSWGGPGFSSSLYEAVVSTFFQNVTFVAAVGNSSQNNDSEKVYPASYNIPNVLAVGASEGNFPASFSNYGVGEVDLHAPGSFILSAHSGGAYIESSGTSMASPFVAGLAALMTQEAPHFSGYQIKRDILASVDTYSAFSGLSTSGGRVNFLKAIERVQANKSEATYNPDFTPEYFDPESASFASQADEGGFGCGRVKTLGNGQRPDGKVNGLFLSFVFLLPLLFWISLRKKYKRVRKVSIQRKHKRHAVNCKGSLLISGSEIPVRITTLSQGGAKLNFGCKKDFLKFKNLHALWGFDLVLQTPLGSPKRFRCTQVGLFNTGVGVSFV